MVRLEAVVIAIFGTLLGIVLGVAIGSALVSALHDQGIDQLVIPFGQLVIYFVIGSIIGVLAALWPARRAAKLNVLRAIATE
jgi:putative ABC transport system permease protein